MARLGKTIPLMTQIGRKQVGNQLTWTLATAPVPAMLLNACHFERSAAKIFSFFELMGAQSRNPEDV